ncbi:MAG: ABC transporter substrate-binding protein [Bacillota bacterium]
MLALLFLLLFGPAAGAFPRTLVDDIGQEISLPEPPQRIVSAALALDNILLFVTDPQRVVAVTRFAADPAYSYVSDRLQPHMTIIDQLNAEQVLALDPDIVLIAVWNDPDTVHQLRDLGVKLYTFARFSTVQDALDNIARIGEITGDEERAQALIDEFHRRAQEVAARVSGRPRPAVLVWDDWGTTVGPGTSAHDIIEMAGGRNVAAEHGIVGWQTIDAEAVVRMNPDVIITPYDPNFVARILSDPALATVKAVRDGRVYYVQHLEALNHHFILAIEALARLLHPEAFAE